MTSGSEPLGPAIMGLADYIGHGSWTRPCPEFGTAGADVVIPSSVATASGTKLLHGVTFSTAHPSELHANTNLFDPSDVGAAIYLYNGHLNASDGSVEVAEGVVATYVDPTFITVTWGVGGYHPNQNIGTTPANGVLGNDVSHLVQTIVNAAGDNACIQFEAGAFYMCDLLGITVAGLQFVALKGNGATIVCPSKYPGELTITCDLTYPNTIESATDLFAAGISFADIADAGSIDYIPSNTNVGAVPKANHFTVTSARPFANMVAGQKVTGVPIYFRHAGGRSNITVSSQLQVDSSSKPIPSSHIKVSDFVTRGGNWPGGQEGNYIDELAGQHCTSLSGSNNIEVCGMDNSRPWGDTMAIAADSHLIGCTFIYVHDNAFYNDGRQLFTCIAGTDIAIVRNNLRQAHRTGFDIEAQGGAVLRRVLIGNNDVANVNFQWLNINHYVGNPDIGDLVIDGNRLSCGWFIAWDNGGPLLWGPITITNNVADGTILTHYFTGYSLNIDHARAVIITGNVLKQQDGSMHGIHLEETIGWEVHDNDVAFGTGQQVTVVPYPFGIATAAVGGEALARGTGVIALGSAFAHVGGTAHIVGIVGKVGTATAQVGGTAAATAEGSTLNVNGVAVAGVGGIAAIVGDVGRPLGSAFAHVGGTAHIVGIVGKVGTATADLGAVASIGSPVRGVIGVATADLGGTATVPGTASHVDREGNDWVLDSVAARGPGFGAGPFGKGPFGGIG